MPLDNFSQFSFSSGSRDVLSYPSGFISLSWPVIVPSFLEVVFPAMKGLLLWGVLHLMWLLVAGNH